jgi:hypothetical protein
MVPRANMLFNRTKSAIVHLLVSDTNVALLAFDAEANSFSCMSANKKRACPEGDA